MGLLPLEFHAHFLLGLTAQTPLLLVQSQDNNSIYGVDSAHCHKLPLILLPTDPNTSHRYTNTQVTHIYNDVLRRSSSWHVCCARLLGRCSASAGHGRPWRR